MWQFTPDYKDKQIETEKTKTYNTPFLSLKRPDFKYVIFKIVEVSPRNLPAKQHSQFGPIPPNVGRIGCAAYSRVSNKRRATFIKFWAFFPSLHSY